MTKYYELAIIFRKTVQEEDYVEYIPIKIVEGMYDEENRLFIDKNGRKYQHIITNPNNYGFLYRDNISDYKKNHPHLTIPLIKALILNSAKKQIYLYSEQKNHVPLILMKKKNIEENYKLTIDKDILHYYSENFPEMYNMLSSKVEVQSNDKEEKQKSPAEPHIELDINRMYAELIDNVINQDEPIRKILTAIWKQYNNFSDSKSRNILINGSTGVGKTETFRILNKMLQVPHFMTSATEYTAAGYVGKSMEDMLIGLLKNANYDLERAQRGILIIDEIDKISESQGRSSQVNQRDVQEALLKILEDGVFAITVNSREYMFDTSRLMVIGLGSWSRIKLDETRPVGFEQKTVKREYRDITRDDMVNEGMIPELVGRFPIIIQMNELDYQSFIQILKSKNSILSINKNFFSSKGVELIVSEEVLAEIAMKAAKQKFGARSLDEIIETVLSEASFEIASNPELYSKLIITSETIQNNKKYTLVKRLHK